MHSLVSIGLRVFVILCSAVVLGLSVTLAKAQEFGSPPPETSFGSFAGAFGIITAFLGIAALYFDSIPALVPLVADGLSALFFLAGGIALAVALKGVSCTAGDVENMVLRAINKILNGGCDGPLDGDRTRCGVSRGNTNTEGVDNTLKSKCVSAQADFAFEFITFVAVLGALVLHLLSSKRSGKGVFV